MRFPYSLLPYDSGSHSSQEALLFVEGHPVLVVKSRERDKKLDFFFIFFFFLTTIDADITLQFLFKIFCCGLTL